MRRTRATRLLVAVAFVLSGLLTLGAQPATATTVPLSTAIYDFMASRSGTITVSVYDAVRQHTWWWHTTVREPTASIVKVDILAAQLHRYGALSAAQRSLATRMIEQSDNDAASALYRQIGGAQGLEEFNELLHLSMTAPHAAWGLTTTSSWDQMLLLRAVALPNRVLTDTQRAYIRVLMLNVIPSQRWGVTAGVPVGVTVAVKNGWLSPVVRRRRLDREQHRLRAGLGTSVRRRGADAQSVVQLRRGYGQCQLADRVALHGGRDLTAH
jgi:hypothetical protein